MRTTMKEVTEWEMFDRLQTFMGRCDVTDLERNAIRWQYRHVMDTLSRWEHALINAALAADADNLAKLDTAFPDSWPSVIWQWKNTDLAEGIRQKGLPI